MPMDADDADEAADEGSFGMMWRGGQACLIRFKYLYLREWYSRTRAVCSPRYHMTFDRCCARLRRGGIVVL